MKEIGNVVIRIGVKEIAALALSIPFVYGSVRKLKLKFDKQEAVANGPDGGGWWLFHDKLYAPDGKVWEETKR